MKKQLILLILIRTLYGGTAQWNLTTGGAWNVTGNWLVISGVGFPNGASDGAIMGGAITGTSTITSGIGITLLNLQFNASTNTYIISLSGNTLVVPEIDLLASNTANQVISAPISLASNSLTVISTSASQLQLSGIISGANSLIRNGAGTGVLQLTNTSNSYTGGTTITAGTISISNNLQLGNTNAGALTLNGGTLLFTGATTIPSARAVSLHAASTIDTGTFTVEVDSNISEVGSNSLTKLGSGTLNIGGVCSYTGGTTINAGTLSILANSAISGSGDVTLGGGTFDISADNANVTIRNLTATSGSVTLGPRTLTFGSSSGGPFTFAGSISGGGGIVKNGTTTATFTASNSFTGGTKVTAGTLALSGSGSLSNGGSVNVTGGTFDISAITNPGTTIGDLLGNAGTTVNLGGKALTFGTATTPAECDSTIIGSGGSLIKNGSGTAVLTATNTYTNGTTINAGSILITADANLGTGGAVTLAGGTLETDPVSPITIARSISLSSASSLQVDIANTTFSAAITGTGPLTKAGGGKAIFTNAGDNYSGGTIINNGTLSISGSGLLSTTGSVSVNSSASIFDISGITAGSFTIGDLTGVASSSVTLGTGKTLTFGTATATSTFAGVISDTTTGSPIIKQGSGTAVFSGANTYIGGTTINAGKLSLSGSGSLNSSSTVTIANMATFDISGTTSGTTIGDLSGVSGSLVALGTGKTLTFGTGTVSTTFAGVISDTPTGSAIVKQGAGIAVFSGANTYIGGTTINAGTLSVSADNNLGGAAGSLTMNGGALVTTATFSSARAVSLLAAGGSFNTNSLIVTTLSGAITGASGALTKTGSGTLTLTNSGNSYGGGTIINGGTLALSGAGILLAAGTVNVNSSNSIFDITGVSSNPNTIGTLTGVLNSSVALGANTLQFGTAASSTFAGIISGVGGAIIKQGSGTTTLSGANTYSGGTTINAGTLSVVADNNLGVTGGLTLNSGTLQTTGSFTYSRAVSLLVGGGTFNTNSGVVTTLSGAITGASGALTKTGSGNLTLTNGSNTYGGGTVINNGTLALSGSGIIPGAMSVNSATSIFDISATTSGATIGDLTGVSGSSVTLGTGKTLTFGTATATATFAGVISDTTTGSAIVKQGAGIAVLSAVNTYIGATSITAGTLSLSGTGSIANSSGVAISGTATFDISGISALGTTIKDLTGTGSTAIALGTNKTLTFGTATATTTFAGIIGDTTTGSAIVKQGAGIAVFSGANTYIGGTTINAGTLSVNANNNLGGTSGSLTLNSGTLQTTGSFSSSRAVSILASGGTFETVGSGVTTTLNGAISGASGALTKIGAGTLVLTSASNSYGGGNTINAGTLSVSLDANLGASSAITINGGTLQTTGSFSSSRAVSLLASGGTFETIGVTTTLNGTISGASGALTKIGSGTLVLTSASNSYGGGNTINVGTLSVSQDANLGAASAITINGGTLQTTGSFSSSRAVSLLASGGTFETIGVTTTLNGAVTGASGALTKIGSGTLVLTSASNSYGGGNFINVGTLSVSLDANLGASSAVTLNGGTLQTTASFSSSRAVSLLASGGTFETVGSGVTTTLSGAVTGASGALTKIGAGTLTLTNASNTYGGGNTINAGTLSVSLDANLGASSAVTLNGGTLQTTGSFATARAVSLLASGGTFETIGVTTTLNGTITGASGALTKIGSGTLVLTGASNSYGGGNTINAGTLSVSQNANLGASSAITINGGTLQTTGSFSTSRAVSLLASGGTFETVGVTTTLNGTITGGSGALTKIGSGTLVLTGASNSYGGGNTINVGTLSVSQDANLGASSAITINGGTLQTTGSFSSSRAVSLLASGGTFETIGVTTTLNGAVTGGSGALTKIGSGTLVLTSASNSYGGGNTINAGTLSVSLDANLGAPSAVTINGGTLQTTASFSSSRAVSLLASGGTFETVGSGVTTTLSSAVTGASGALTKIGAGTLTLTSASNSYGGGTVINNGTLALSGSGAISNTAAVNVNSSTSIFNISATTSGTTTIGDLTGVASSSVVLGSQPLTFGTATPTATFGGVISGASGAIVKQGSGAAVLTAINTYTGATSITTGTLSLSGAGAIANSSGVAISGTATFDITGISAPGTTIQDLTGTGSTSITLGSKALTFGTDTVGPLTFAGVISDPGSGSIVKQGSGTAILSGMNTFTAGTTITGGILSVSLDANLGDPAGDLTLDGGTLETTASFMSARTVSLLSGGGTFQTDSSVTTTLNGPIGGIGSLTKTGPGTLVLTNASNNYTGGTIINDGSLQLSGAGDIVGGVNLTSSSAVFDISTASGGVTIGDLSGVSLSSVLLGNNSLTFGTSTPSATFAGIISDTGSGSIIKRGSGTAILSGANTYAGGTTINAGTLSIMVDGNLGNVAGALTITNGTLQTTASSTLARAISLGTATFETVGVTTILTGVISGGSLTKIGTGTLSLANGANNYTGVTTINAGTLSYSADGAILGGNSVVVGNGVAAASFSIEATMTAPNALNVTVNAASTMVGTSGTAIQLSSLLGAGTLDLGTGVRNINIAPTSSDAFPGKITGGVASASSDPTTGNRLTISGPQTFTLSNSSSDFVSRLFVASGGTLEAQNGLALGAAGANSAAYVQSGGTLQIDGSINLAKTILLNGTGSGGNGALRSLSGTNTASQNVTIGWSGGPEVAMDATIQVDAGSLTVTGVVAGSNNLSKVGVGSLTFGGSIANTLSGTTTVNAGTLFLNKPNGTLALNGPLTINTTGVAQLSAPNQISDTTTVTLSGGTFNMNANAETIGQLVFTSGTLTQGGALLTLNSGANTALTMTGNTISGPIAFNGTSGMTLSAGAAISGSVTFNGAGDVVYSGGATSTLSGTVNLGSFAHTFDISSGTGSPDLNVSGAITGTGSITKSTSTGLLAFTGNTINTYSGLTTVSAGTLLLNKSISDSSIAGNVTLNTGGTLQLGAPEQISNSSVVTLNGGSWNMAAFNETIGQLIFTTGTLTQGGALLTLNSGLNTALTMTGNTISGPLAFNSTSGMTLSNGAAISGNITFNGAGDVVYTGGTPSTLSGSINLGNFAHTFNIAPGSGSPDLNVTGAVSGNGSITKSTGTGVLAFTGSATNTYSGLTTVNAGTLLLNRSSSHGSIAGNVTLNTGGTLLLGASNQINTSSVVTLSGGLWDMATFNETIGQLIFSSGTLTQGGALLTLNSGLDTALTMTGNTISGPLAFNTTSGMTLSAGAAISGSVTFNGAGNVISSGGATSTLSGTVDLGSFTHTFNIAPGTGSPDLNVSGVIIGSGSITKSTGTGVLAFTGNMANTYSGLTTVSAGTLLLNKTITDSSIAGNVNVNSGGTLLLGASDQINDSSIVTLSGGTWNMASFNETVNQLVFTSGTLTQGGGLLTLSSGLNTALTMIGTTITGPIAFSGTSGMTLSSGAVISGSITFNGAGDVVYSGGAASTISGSLDLGNSAHTFNIAAGSGSPDLTISGAISGNGAVTKSTGTGVLAFSGNTINTYSGITTVSAGTLLLNKTISNSSIAGNVALNSGGTLLLGASEQINNSSQVTLGGGTWNMASFNETIGQLIFTSGTLTQGGGLLTLSSGLNNALTMTGNTISGPIAFSGASGMTIGSGATISGSVTFNGAGDVVYSGGATSTLSGTVNLGSFAHTFNIPAGSGSPDLNVSGAITGTGSITKSTGTGVLAFTGNTTNTYSGLTTVNAGTLLLNKTVTNSSIAANVALNAGGTLQLGASEQINNSSQVTLNGGTWNMATFNETIGQLVFSTGTLTQGGGLLTLNSGLNTALTMTGNTISGPIAFNTTSGMTLSAGAAISGNVTFNGAGDVVYTGGATSTLSGTVNLGSFAHTFNIATGSGSPDLNVTGAITGGGSITKSTGTGVLAFTGSVANTYSGLTTVNAGTLLLNKTISDSSIAGNVTLNSGGTLLLGAADQISNSSIVTLSGGTWNMATFNETVGQLIFSSGTFTQGGGVLTVTNSLDTAVTMSNSTTIAGNVVFAATSGLTMGDGTTISGNLTFQGSGGVNYNGASSTATISGNIDLGGFAHNFTTASGATPGMIASGVLSGSGSTVTKLGPGQLEFSGGSANTYNGLTTVSAGSLLLNKTAGVNAIAANVLVNGGNLLLGAANQIANTATMTISSGSFGMAGNNEQIDNLVINGGSVAQGGATLTLSPAGAVALTVGGTSTISGGSLSLPGTSQIVFNGTTGTGTISSDLNLNAASHTFNIGASSSGLSVDIQGVISNGTVTKTGAGVLRFSGSSANTYSGLTTVSGGTLLLQKTAANAIVGNALVNSGGTLALGAASQIIDSATVTLGGGTMNMSGFAETINTLIFTSGTLTQGGATLSLVSVSMNDNTLISGPLSFTAIGGLAYTGSSATATISGNVDLGSFAQNFAIANGSASIDQTISGIISNGSLDKTGAGTLLLTGANTYGGGTIVSAGTLQGNTTSLQGNIANSANLVFDQAGAGNYAGSISGAGTLTKMGAGSVNLTAPNTTGPVTVSAGTLLVDVTGTLAGGGPMTVASGATLGGTGIVTKDITFSGSLSPGNSIGTIHLVGNQTFAPGFNLINELNPVTSDLVDITGTLLIDPGTTLTIEPMPGTYSDTFTFTLVQTTGGITGTFTNVVNTLPVFTATIVYTGFDILLEAGFRPFNELVTTGNAAQVAKCLAGFTPSIGSDLAFIINELRASPDTTVLTNAMNQMQPSQYTVLAIMQENNTLYLNEGLFNHLESLTARCQAENLGVSLWSVPFVANQRQSRDGITQGYSSNTPGILLGIDGKVAKDFVLGFAAGYSYTHLKWTGEIGRATEQVGYGALYGRWAKKHGYLETSFIYGYSRYKTDRYINFNISAPVNRDAEGRHKGMQGSAHFKAAVDWTYKDTTVEPFGDIAYIYIHENRFTEHGAQSLDLDVMSKNSNLLMSEGGLRISHCKLARHCKMLTPYVQGSVIYESRWLGKHEKALFNGCPLNVTGLNPSRIMAGVEAGVHLTLNDQAGIFSIFYKGRFAERFADNTGYLQLDVKF